MNAENNVIYHHIYKTERQERVKTCDTKIEWFDTRLVPATWSNLGVYVRPVLKYATKVKVKSPHPKKTEKKLINVVQGVQKNFTE